MVNGDGAVMVMVGSGEESFLARRRRPADRASLSTLLYPLAKCID